jgi:DNA primase
MGLFPPAFIEDLKHHADIVVVVQDYVSLRKVGGSYKGLCPFHGEKTPSFHVNRDKGFFHCFGCGVGGDVFKFLELHDRIGFQDAVRQLAARFGLPVPEVEQSEEQRVHAAEREALLRVHEAAADWFRGQLETHPAAARARAQVADRGVTEATAGALRLGFAPPGGDALAQALAGPGYTPSVLLRAGLVVAREDGRVVDRFRNRLMIPICRETGAVIAFGGRAVEAGQQPKYLNSPETPLYSKGRTLYGLHLSKQAIRARGFAVLVEGYFDFAQVWQAGFEAAVASCGTALTPQQARQLRRFTGRVVLSFDPDAAGEGATVKSCEMLVAEGFEVNVAVLPPGGDPDTFIRQQGRAAYGERLRRSQPYLEYLLDRAAARPGAGTPEGRARLVAEMVQVAARIPDRVRQELFVEALAARARVTGDVVLREVRKGGVPVGGAAGGGEVAGKVTSLEPLTQAEKGLVWLLVHRPEVVREAIPALEDPDLEGLAAGRVLDLARKLNDDTGFSPSLLLERLDAADARLVTGIASGAEPPVHDPGDCVRILKRRRYEREKAMLQREIDRIQQRGATGYEHDIDALWARKRELLQRIEGL